MKNDIIFITDLKANDPNLDAYKQYSLLTWEFYCKKHNIELVRFDSPITDTEQMRPTWQRWWAYDMLNASQIAYNRVMLVDIDTMVRWDCPNLFDLTQGKYGAVIDDLSIEWVWNSIQGYKKFFPNTELNWYEYVNNGILVLPNNGEYFCEMVKSFYLENSVELRNLQHNTLKKGTDQTPVNFLMRQTYNKDEICILPKIFNLTHIYKTDAVIDNIYIKAAYIWHFNGIPRNEREKWMKHTWELIKDNYR